MTDLDDIAARLPDAIARQHADAGHALDALRTIDEIGLDAYVAQVEQALGAARRRPRKPKRKR